MKVFWSWQSDIDEKTSRHFVKDCIEKAISDLKDDSIIDERSEIDHDTKGELGIPSIADTILSKIDICDVFIADITPVGVSYTSDKKLMNPNVAIELGYTIGKHGHKKVINIMNEHYGNIQDLPFDLRHKRGPVFYNLKPSSSTEEIKIEKNKIIGLLKSILTEYAKFVPVAEEGGGDLDKNGKAIYFIPEEPLVRIANSPWEEAEKDPYFFKSTNNYIYLKIEPVEKKTYSKAEVKKIIFDKTFHFTPFMSRPDTTPEVNRYGAIITHFTENKAILDLTQIFTNSSLVGINTSLLKYSSGSLFLTDLHRGISKAIKEYFDYFQTELDNTNVMIEVGICIDSDRKVIIPGLLDKTKYYRNHERGPIEKGIYKVSKKVEIKNTEAPAGLNKDLVMHLINEIGLEFDYEIHDWGI